MRVWVDPLVGAWWRSCPAQSLSLTLSSTIFAQSHDLTQIPFQDLLPFNLAMKITRFSKQPQCSNLFYFFTCMHALAHCTQGDPTVQCVHCALHSRWKRSCDSSVYRWWFSAKIQRPCLQESTALAPRAVINLSCFPCFHWTPHSPHEQDIKLQLTFYTWQHKVLVWH